MGIVLFRPQRRHEVFGRLNFRYIVIFKPLSTWYFGVSIPLPSIEQSYFTRPPHQRLEMCIRWGSIPWSNNIKALKGVRPKDSWKIIVWSTFLGKTGKGYSNSFLGETRTRQRFIKKSRRVREYRFVLVFFYDFIRKFEAGLAYFGDIRHQK